MRVALVAHWFGEFVVRQANALASHAHVSLLYPRDALGRERELLCERVHHVPIPKHPRRSMRNLLAARGIARLILAERPDVIHVHANGHARLMLALPWLRRVPLIATVHDPVPHPGESTWVRRWAGRALRRRADHFVLHGEALCRVFHETWGVAPDRMTFTHLGAVDFAHWRDETLEPPARDHILFFGRIRPYKGLDVLIEAARRLRHGPEAMKIVIAGGGEDLAPQRRQIEAAGQTERFVILNEFIPEPMADALFRHARAVVLPYTQASQSGPATTACAYGKPIVASDVGGLPDIVHDGETGLLTPPGDAEALALALERIAGDDALAKRLGAGARRLAEQELSWETLAPPTLEAYQRAIEAHSRRGR